VVRQVPAVKYQYDDLLNRLDILSLAAAFISLIAVLAVQVERRAQSLASYNVSIELPASWVLIAVNLMLVVYSVNSFWPEFRGLAMGVLGSMFRVFSGVGARLSGPCEICGLAIMTLVGGLAYVFCCLWICACMCRNKRKPEQLRSSRPTF